MAENNLEPWDFASKMEETLSLVKQMQNVGNLDPRTEELVKRINKLQQVYKRETKELSEAKEHNKALQKELEKLNTEKSTLEEIWNEKKETRKVMQLRCEESEAKMQRQQKLNQECKQRIEAIAAQIQEEKQKQSEQRSEFERLLEELMEKHKRLWELRTRKKTVADMKESKEHLLSEEKLLQEKLVRVQEELDLLSQLGLSEEKKFLTSPEAQAALELFEEENKKAKQHMETSKQCYSDLEQRFNRLKAELEDLEMEKVSITDD